MGRHLSNSRRKTCRTRILYLAKTFFKNKDKDFSDKKKQKKVKTVTSRPMIQKKKKLKEVSQVFYKKRKLFREKRDNAR